MASEISILEDGTVQLIKTVETHEIVENFDILLEREKARQLEVDLETYKKKLEDQLELIAKYEEASRDLNS